MILVVLIIIFAAGFLYLSFPAKAGKGREIFTGHPFAHRGLYDNDAGIPENSLPAFRRAVEHLDLAHILYRKLTILLDFCGCIRPRLIAEQHTRRDRCWFCGHQGCARQQHRGRESGQGDPDAEE